jgi:GST-like protein
MIDVYFWPTGNGKKITIMLEECGLDYRIHLIDIGKGDQFAPEFLKISPNGKMPAIVDHEAQDGPVTIFESGAILQYLAEKTGRLLPKDVHGKYRVLQWVFWQVGGLGPMAGQAHHFLRYCKEDVPYAKERFRTETARLYGVLDRQLADNDFIAGDYSIADIAAWPWVIRHDWQEQDLDDFPNVKRWFAAVKARPAVAKAEGIGMFLMDKSRPVTALDRQLIVNLPAV